MKLAVTCGEDGSVFQHFGHTPIFAIFTIENGAVTSGRRLNCGGAGHETLAELLHSEGIETLICGRIGAGAVQALGNVKIEIVGGAEGNVDKVAADYAAGRLATRSDFGCRAHGHAAGCGHTCGGNHGK